MEKKISRSTRIVEFYKLFWVFVISGVLGFLVETLWCRYSYGMFTSRTSNLFFPMSVVWAFGGVAVSFFLRNSSSEKNHIVFIRGMVLCAAVEALCGYIGEWVLGVTFWDYSAMRLNIGKYINVPFCIVWGLLSIVWVRKIYPFIDGKLAKFMEKVPVRLSQYFLLFMIVTNLVSGMALLRMQDRTVNPAASNAVERTLDAVFPDQRLQKYFPKMKTIATGEPIVTVQR